ncbi:MAG: hypothetical protein H0U22_08695 [Geodermatophilaceae bacterium]|nr:hypothetical protein [Geodermatophilaceae bacterium]
MNQAYPLALLAAALCLWPGRVAVIRLARALDLNNRDGSSTWAVGGWGRARWPNARWFRGLLVVGGVAVLAQVWALPVAAVLIAIAVTAGTGLVRMRQERAVVGEEQGAVEGLGVLVAELRAGRPADQALEAAGRHCGHQNVGAVLTRLGRSLRLGDRLEGWMRVDERAPPLADARGSVQLTGQLGASQLGSSAQRDSAQRDSTLHGSVLRGSKQDPAGSRWQSRLIAGLRLSQRTGCALADVVAAVESDLARRGHQRADVRATAAGHRATVALLAGLPVLGLAMGSGIGAEPVRILTTTTIGHVLLITGVALELVGLAWSRRMTRAALREG